MESSTKTAGDILLSPGDLFVQTFRDLLKQRELLDRRILKLQGKFFKMIEKKTKGSVVVKKYVARMQNDSILVEAIRGSMIVGRRMDMKAILTTLQKNGAYHTKSTYFYTMVNNKLNRDPCIKKVSRGIFVLQKRPGKVVS